MAKKKKTEPRLGSNTSILEAATIETLDEAYLLTLLLAEVNPAISKERTYELLVQFLGMGDLNERTVISYGKLIRKSAHIRGEDGGTH